ncbi:FACT complex subunit (SPT16/CDC68) domain-containing protein [Ditylenchus destructor]|nr:FACT complex subunit (SPT16/CDC68) domain-containing protein [Ditylenchus destructor]
MSKTLKVDKDYFINRATRIYEFWNNEREMSSINSLIFMVSNSEDDNIPYSKSHSLQTWLFNCSLPDTLLILTKAGIYFLGSDRKVQFFSPLVSERENLNDVVPPFTSYARNKADKDKANFEQLLDIATKGGKTCGWFAKDKADSEFSKSWEDAVKAKSVSLTDVSLFFAKIFAVKDQKEIELMKKSAEASINAWGYLRKKIVEVVDTEKKVSHNKLADDFEQAMTTVQVQGPLAKTNALEVCYAPIIQSGDQCTLKFSCESNKKLLHYGSIVGTLGARFMFYCSNVARTIMVMPTPLMEELYELVLTTELAVIEALKPGSRICDAYEAGLKHFTEKKKDYVKYLQPTSFGFVTGIEFREGLLLINSKCKQLVETNMTLVVAIGLQNFPNPASKDDSGKTASIFISDTILVCDNGPNEVLTERAKSRLRSNTIRFRGPETSNANEAEEVANAQGRAMRSVVLQEQTRHKQTNEEKRKERQKELAEALNNEARQRLSAKPGTAEALKAKKSNISYKSEDKFPDEPEVDKLMIYVDKRNDTVIVPIFGVPVPFHISMIKNASQTVEGDYTFLRINFTHPGSQIGKDNVQFPNPLAKFLKELSFKSSNVREPGEVNPPSANLSTALRLIKEMQKRFRTMEAEEREKEGAVKQDKLILSTGKGNPKLKDLYVRPNIIAKRISGSLEAHVNGFRYTSLRGDKIDVLYNNIKHAFFQPCDNEMIILVHFHLKHPVLWGKKKYADVQFYTEVGEITTDLNKYHHMQDRDDIQSEQMEREMRRKLNAAFQSFCEKVVRLTNEAVDFDMPFNDLGFIGVPYRSSVSLKPTSSCLVNLTEWPPFVVTLDEVELVHFERVTSNTKSFDMVIIFKDYHRKTQQIGHIPSSSLDSIKDWLNSCDIRYSEGPMSLNWNNIMKTIIDDPEAFFENGGWNFILKDSDDEGEEDESEESSFAPSGEESEESDEDEEENSAEPSSDEESEASLDSEESEGKDWSDLEEEAARADRSKDNEVDDTDRKRKGRGPGPAPKRRR